MTRKRIRLGGLLGSFIHVLVGVLTVLSIYVSPVFPVLGFVGFIIYELDEDWHISDYAYKDIREFMVGFFATISVILGIKFIFLFNPLL